MTDGKGKAVSVYRMKVYWGPGSTAPLTFNLDIRWRSESLSDHFTPEEKFSVICSVCDRAGVNIL